MTRAKARAGKATARSSALDVIVKSGHLMLDVVAAYGSLFAPAHERDVESQSAHERRAMTSQIMATLDAYIADGCGHGGAVASLIGTIDENAWNRISPDVIRAVFALVLAAAPISEVRDVADRANDEQAWLARFVEDRALKAELEAKLLLTPLEAERLVDEARKKKNAAQEADRG